MELDEIAMLYRTIKRHYAGFDASVAAIQESHRYLIDIDYETAVQNVDNHIRTKTFWPTIAEIRGTTREAAERYIPSIEETRRMLQEQRNFTPVGPTPEQRERVMRNGRTL